MKKINALAIVAHPDDEIIWMGGMILKHKNWNWTIYSLCRRDDRDRAPKFFRVCALLGVHGIIDDLDDKVLKSLDETEIIMRVIETFGKKKFDYLFTHGENGEYGHIRHCEIHAAIKKMVEKKMISCKKLYFFHYSKGKNVLYPRLVSPRPRHDGDIVLELTPQHFEEKKRIVREMYGYSNEKGFELMSCHTRESFKQN